MTANATVGIVIRAARAGDLGTIQAIYAHHVLHGTASFEEIPPSTAEIAERRAAMLARDLPYFVAEVGDRVVGYAYAAPYRPRSAYRYTVEDSVYIDPQHLGRGIGRALLARLIEACENAGLRQMVAVIGDSANAASIALHAKLGFQRAGLLPAVGFKFGRWIDSVLMQRSLGKGASEPPAW
ncbi:MAG: N-acetyltransferase family protein [Gammaproteobacteria bacterium]